MLGRRRDFQPGSGRDIVMVIATLLGCLPQIAVANSGGIFGFSGRGNGAICTSCHSGGQRPDVAFEAPQGTEMLPDAIATFRFRVTSNRPNQQTHAGFDVSPSGGTLGIIDPGTKFAFPGLPDITHDQPRANDGNGIALFEFIWQAPAIPGTYTLFGAGNSVNFDGGAGGDNAAATTLSINVVEAATPTPTATATATPGPCTGDCDGGGSVTVDEIVRGVNIGLGSGSVDDCPAFDRDGDGSVTVDEIVEAIGHALEGCG